VPTAGDCEAVFFVFGAACDFHVTREHASFCWPLPGRVDGNGLTPAITPAEGGALGWTITAMRETSDRLAARQGWERTHAFAGSARRSGGHHGRRHIGAYTRTATDGVAGWSEAGRLGDRGNLRRPCGSLRTSWATTGPRRIHQARTRRPRGWNGGTLPGAEAGLLPARRGREWEAEA